MKEQTLLLEDDELSIFPVEMLSTQNRH